MITVGGFLALIFIAQIATGSWEVWGKVITVDDFSTEVEVRWGAGRAGGGQHRQPLRVRQIAGTVSIIILVVVVLL